MPEPQQITAGTTYSDGGEVTFINLNNHVNLAKLVVGAITGQDDAASVNLTDTLLIQQVGSLKEATFTQVKDSMSLGDYVKRDGTAGMNTSAQLTLGTTAQLSDLHAASVGYLNANFLKNSGTQALVGSLNVSNFVNIGTSQNIKLTTAGISFLSTNQIVTLSRSPIEDLEAATKKYVDTSGFKSKAIFSGQFADATPISGNYFITSTSTIDFTFSNADHGFLQGHKLGALCIKLTGTVPGYPIVYVVTSVTGNVVSCKAQVTALVNGGTGTFTVYKCKMHMSFGSNEIVNIIYGPQQLAPVNSGKYIVNLTDNEFLDNVFPFVSPSFASNDTSSAKALTLSAPVVLYDYSDVGIQITRTNTAEGSDLYTNSFVFTTSYINAVSADCGYRSGIVIV